MITEFSIRPSGGRSWAFAVRGVEVVITSPDEDGDVYAAELAKALHAEAHGYEAMVTVWEQCALLADGRARKAEDTLRVALDKIPPPQPVSLLGHGCVRFASTGELWLLNKREDGFASFGVRLNGWDDLFRRYNVRITEHGTDRCGEWWTAEPIKAGS